MIKALSDFWCEQILSNLERVSFWLSKITEGFTPCTPLILHLSCTYQCQPFKPPDAHTNSPHWSPYISFKNSWENLIKDQSLLLLVINLVILITFTLDDLLMLLGENWCWSLLGPKELSPRDGEVVRGVSGLQTWSNRLSLVLGNRSFMEEKNLLNTWAKQQVCATMWWMYTPNVEREKITKKCPDCNIHGSWLKDVFKNDQYLHFICSLLSKKWHHLLSF